MDKKKNRILWSIAALLIAALSFWAVSSQAKDFTLSQLFEYVRTANPFWIGAALLCMLLFIGLEAVAIRIIIDGFGYKRSYRQTLLYSASDIYFSAITPSATGGQPICAYFMIKDGIPVGTVTISLIVNLVLYSLSTMIAGVIAIIIRPTVFFNFNIVSRVLIVAGCLIFGGLAFLFIMLIRRGDIVHKFGNGCIRFLSKLHIIKRREHYEEKLVHIMEEYTECAHIIKDKQSVIVRAFLCNFFQRLAQMVVPAMVFLGKGGDIAGALDVWVSHVLVTIGAGFVPIPGAMGVIDYMLLDGFGSLMCEEEAINLELVSRSISFYSCLILCAVIAVLGFIKYGRRKEEVK